MSASVGLDFDTLGGNGASETYTTQLDQDDGIKIEKGYNGVGYATDENSFVLWWESNGVHIFALASILFLLFMIMCIWWICRKRKDQNHKVIHEESTTNHGLHGQVIGHQHSVGHQQAFHDDHGYI